VKWEYRAKVRELVTFSPTIETDLSELTRVEDFTSENDIPLPALVPGGWDDDYPLRFEEDRYAFDYGYD
jgi:hypothetical protein